MVGVRKSGSLDLAGIGEFCGISSIVAPSGEGRLSRGALFAGASLVALGTFAPPAEALCTGSNQTVSTSETSTAQSNGGGITITNGGSITAKLGITLFSAPNGCSAGTISNAGSINYSTYGVINQNSITTLTNGGTIVGSTATKNGGAAVFSTGTIQTLTNNAAGTIGGGKATGATSAF